MGVSKKKKVLLLAASMNDGMSSTASAAENFRNILSNTNTGHVHGCAVHTTWAGKKHCTTMLISTWPVRTGDVQEHLCTPSVTYHHFFHHHTPSFDIPCSQSMFMGENRCPCSRTISTIRERRPCSIGSVYQAIPGQFIAIPTSYSKNCRHPHNIYLHPLATPTPIIAILSPSMQNTKLHITSILYLFISVSCVLRVTMCRAHRLLT